MHKKSIALAIAATLGIGASFAIAGSHAVMGFYVSPSNGYSRYANGAFGEIRNDASDNFAECGSNETSAFCSFVQNNQYSYCWTTDPGRMAVIRGMNGDSVFSVMWLEQSAECNYVVNYASSRFQPKGP